MQFKACADCGSSVFLSCDILLYLHILTCLLNLKVAPPSGYLWVYSFTS